MIFQFNFDGWSPAINDSRPFETKKPRTIKEIWGHMIQDANIIEEISNEQLKFLDANVESKDI